MALVGRFVVAVVRMTEKGPVGRRNCVACPTMAVAVVVEPNNGFGWDVGSHCQSQAAAAAVVVVVVVVVVVAVAVVVVAVVVVASLVDVVGAETTSCLVVLHDRQQIVTPAAVRHATAQNLAAFRTTDQSPS